MVEFDIKGAFDQIEHGLLMKAVRAHIREDWILLYIERWLTAPFEKEGSTPLPRERGTPQVGVVSPILMNLFMHYVFDCWKQRSHPQCPFARYADDAVVRCHSQKQAEAVMQSIAFRLKECGLMMHPEKSKIVYCKHSRRTKDYPLVKFTFLGFTFRPRRALNKQNRRFTSFLPGVSEDALKRIRLEVRGWCQYYGAFYPTAMRRLYRYIDEKLEQWARRKYKTLKRHMRRSVEWLNKMKDVLPQMFAHWRVVGGEVG